MKTHGHSPATGRSKEYRSWQGMFTRCTNPKATDYHLYGGRGVTVCERWESFENFLADMGERPSPTHTLDRYPDKNGNYEPTNCRWATPAEQSRNTSRNRLLTIDGVTRPVCDWSAIYGIDKGTVAYRLNKGMDPKTAVTTPPRNSRRKRSETDKNLGGGSERG